MTRNYLTLSHPTFVMPGKYYVPIFEAKICHRFPTDDKPAAHLFGLNPLKIWKKLQNLKIFVSELLVFFEGQNNPGRFYS